MMARSCRWIGLLVLIVSLAGCGVTSGAASEQRPPTPTATLAPVPTATATATPSTSVTMPCNPLPGGGIVTLGDLQATLGLAGQSYPARKLPDGLPLAPLELQDASPAALDAQLPPSPLTDPSMTEPSGGYWMSICNTSKTHTHSLGHVSVQIASFTAYGGQLNEWDSADTKCGTIYGRPQGVSGGGCGGGVTGIACMDATFPPGGGVGSTVSAAFNANPGCMTGATLPLALPPGQELDFALGIMQPSTPGTFTFTMNLVTDAGVITFAPTAPVLLAPVAHHWTGEACTNSAMQAQIPPATNPPTVYICPA